ncbi:MAG: tRNA-dihydrouridine synthase family protein [Lachnospiraceae bacterium]|nr:tRNA-dihydrouridine synthase family protein [Lachnospiraceae bacterium]
MKFYMAPMEGITNHIYRQAHLHHFGHIDRYYMPFLSSLGLNYKEIRDIAPENNQGMDIVPQVLTNHAEIFLGLAEMFRDLGYTEVNLNIGCPSGTVTAKGRGSGFLRHLPELEIFLDEIFEKSALPISIKTRIGYASEEEWPAILELLIRYPATELIIHPRLRQDLYKGPVRPDAYELAERTVENPAEQTWEKRAEEPEKKTLVGCESGEMFGDRDKIDRSDANRRVSPLCYNGDIYSVEDYQTIHNRFPNTDRVMLGRGLIGNPGLAGELKGKAPMTRSQLEGFLDELFVGYRNIIPEDKNILFRLLEVWTYLARSFPEGDKVLKRIRKSKSLAEYRSVVAGALEEFE